MNSAWNIWRDSMKRQMNSMKMPNRSVSLVKALCWRQMDIKVSKDLISLTRKTSSKLWIPGLVQGSHRWSLPHISSYTKALWWRHQIKTFVRGIHRSPVNSPHKGQWRGALMFSFVCAPMNDWVNNREAGDLRRHRAHYDVTVMRCKRSPGHNVMMEAKFNPNIP